MPIEKKKFSKNDNINEFKIAASNDQNGSDQLKGWVIAIGIVLVILIVFVAISFNMLNSQSNIQIQQLKGKISDLEQNGSWEVYTVTYGGGSSTSNNLKWIGEKSLGFPEYLKGKNCYILGSKIDGAEGGTVRGYLGKNGNENSYSTAINYEAQINNREEKIEITKWNGYSSSMLTKSERDNLYFSLTLLCR